LETIASRRLVVALCLCLAAAGVSGLLLLQHHGVSGAVSAVNQVCGEGESSGCEAVAQSRWSSFGGVPVAAVGLGFYLSLSLLLALALLASSASREVLSGFAVLGLGAALLVDVGLLGVQAFAVRAFCVLCLLTYVLGAAAFFALFPARRGARGLGLALGSAEGRVGMAGFLLGTLALAVAVLGIETALDERESRSHLAMLGGPAPVAATSPSEPEPAATPAAEATPESAEEPEADPTPEEPQPREAAKPSVDWEARARQLQATLDDPQKLEAYFAAKARREFESAKVEPIDLANTPVRGPADAPVKVVEYSDFLCPFCRNLAMGLAQFVPQAGGRVAIYYKNFPLDQECNDKLKGTTHPGACWLALGGVCAERQGRFEAYHDRVFSADNLHNPQPADVARLAGEAGLNAAAIDGCLRDPETRRTLEAQIAEANRLGVRSTPTVYINGKKLPRINDFVAVVDAEAQKKGFPALNPQ